jgi:outer membrane receptor protein involved in Fe transport
MLKTKLAAAVLVALSLGPTVAFAHGSTGQDATTAQQNDAQSTDQARQTKQAKKLEAVTVTGSLIPQTQIENATPVTTITAEQLKARGFTTVAEALQQSSFATGSVQGTSTSGSFTQGAKTLSLFGLPPGFIKYLIDGRPMGNFPGLYNGSDVFNNLTGIPAEMVDHIDILPGGQSSIYGSDAIAGVINIVLKKHLDGPVVDMRYGWMTGGGGADRRVYLADSFNAGRFNLVAGVQYESTQPIWGFDRGLTKQRYTQGATAPYPSYDYLIYSATKLTNSFYFEDPANCANVASQFHGTTVYNNRVNNGGYCGSEYAGGYRTLTNDDTTANGYAHATFDVNDNLQLYGDLLYNYEEQKYTEGSNYIWWGSSDFGYIYDENLDDFVSLQRAFSPEDVGGYKNIENKQTENSYMLSLGGKGTFGDSNWDYDIGFTHSDDKIISRNFQRFAGPIDAWFEEHVLGPQHGWDPYYNAYPAFSPDYANFYQPISPADFASFTGYTTTHAKTWDNMLRGQLTNTSLFSLPGGDAGMAVVLEGGNQGWDYTPDPRLLDGTVWGTTDVQGSGHRSRYAATAEFNMPLFSMLTLDASGRYDSYKVLDKDVSHGTYNVALEFRPFESLLVRGKYGTAFKVPTLSDEFQGTSGYYSFVTDYSNCARVPASQGGPYTGSNIGDCPQKYGSVQFFGQTTGTPDLKPITAKVWNYGIVWAPTAKFSASVDYYHYDVDNEVTPQSADQLTNQEYLCNIGTIDINSPTCQAAFSQIIRGQSTNPTYLGTIQEIDTPKVNTANELVNALVANLSYLQDVGSFGALTFAASYSDVLKHTSQAYPGDTHVDLLRHPAYSTEFKTKVNGSVTWSKDKWSATLYGNRYGSTPNYAATQADNYTAKGAGKLAPWITYNASLTFNPVDNLALSFLVNNLFNNMPPEDHTYPGNTSSPYNEENYNVYGRGYYLQATYKFGK